MQAIDLILHTPGYLRCCKELRIPLTARAKRPICFQLHDFQSRTFIRPDIEIRPKSLQRSRLRLYGCFPILRRRLSRAALEQTAVPALGQAIVHRCIGNQFVNHIAGKYLLGQQYARPRVPGSGVQVRFIQLHGPTLALDVDMVLELIFKVLTGCAVSRAQMAHVRHIVQDLLRVDRQLAQVIQLPAHPLGVVPFGQEGRSVIRLAPVRVVPGHYAAHVIDDRIGADGSRFGVGALRIRDVIYIALRTVAPAVIGAADRVALDLFAILDDHGTGAGGQVRAHVGAVGIQ